MKKLTLALFVMLFSMQINSQEKIISGTISDENGLPLPGVNIIVKGTTKGTQTDFDGNYKIKAHAGDILSFSFLGYITEEKTVGVASNISFAMSVDSNALEEVVVTAFGIKRTKSISKRIVLRDSSGMEYGVESEPEHGQLTAGEINDLEKWEEWKTVLKQRSFKNLQDKWDFYLENRIEVTVKDLFGKQTNNIKVSLYNENNELIMASRTDITGKAILFKDLNNKFCGQYFRIQLNFKNKIIGKKITNTYDKVEFIIDHQNNSDDIDIMFTIDATGSMGDEIDYLKAELKNIISRLDKSIQKKRVALTFYRDIGDDYVVKDFDFNPNINKVKEVLSNQFAAGGGDYQEAVEKALEVSMQKSWNLDAKSKLLFLLLDAPPHFTKENVEKIKEQIKIAQESGIKIIPIVASDADKDVEFLMRFFSVSTNGTYVFLTNDSGIGNDHLEPTTKAFKVEMLNDLIVRLIEKYSGVIS